METAITAQCFPKPCFILVSVKSFGLLGKQEVWEEMVSSLWKSGFAPSARADDMCNIQGYSHGLFQY